MACFSLAEVLLATQATKVCLASPSNTLDASLPHLNLPQELVFSSVSTDTRTLPPGALFVALQGENHDGQVFVAQAAQKGARGALVLRGFVPKVSLPAGFVLLEVEDSLKALGQLAHFHRKRTPLPLGAITGSSGKTTTKEFVSSILQQRGEALATEGNLNNEVGLPLTLFGLSLAHWAGVVEMGMSHPGEISRLAAIAMPNAGLITSIHAAHLAGLGSLEAVAQAKGELFEALPAEATALVCADEPKTVEQAKRCKARQLHYGKSAGVDLRLVEVVSLGMQGQRIRWEWRGQAVEARLRLVGEHNALNATAALAMGLVLGCDMAGCVRGIESTSPIPRRLSLRRGFAGTQIVDDCYNANPASMQAAIDTAVQLASPKRPVLVLGDMLELGKSEEEAHTRMGELAALCARLSVFIGPRMRLAWEKAHARMGEAALWFERGEGALEAFRGLLCPGDVVLVKASRSMHLECIADALSLEGGGEGGCEGSSGRSSERNKEREEEGDHACSTRSIPS
jgi:UDP-N-acetylmuramoyl-tripeptide--D-alanyl-D-alanine ligase